MTEEAMIPMTFARFGRRGVLPHWASRMQAEAFPAENLLSAIPCGVWVLEATDSGDLKRHSRLVQDLNHRIFKSRSHVELVVHFVDASASRSGISFDDYLKVYRQFPSLGGRIEVAWGRDDLQPRVMEAMAKCIAAAESRQTKPDPLSAALEVQQSRSELISPKTGRLDASKIAAALGMSLASLAGLMGKARATVNKTPDAPALQAPLRTYERILRLKARLAGDDLLAWLEAPNRHLDNRSPRSLIEEGRAGVVADLVEDALTGQPT